MQPTRSIEPKIGPCLQELTDLCAQEHCQFKRFGISHSKVLTHEERCPIIRTVNYTYIRGHIVDRLWSKHKISPGPAGVPRLLYE